MEDSPAGIEAARRAGMAVVGITTTHRPAALATPHLVRDFTARVSLSPLVGEGTRKTLAALISYDSLLERSEKKGTGPLRLLRIEAFSGT